MDESTLKDVLLIKSLQGKNKVKNMNLKFVNDLMTMLFPSLLKEQQQQMQRTVVHFVTCLRVIISHQLVLSASASALREKEMMELDV